MGRRPEDRVSRKIDTDDLVTVIGLGVVLWVVYKVVALIVGALLR